MITVSLTDPRITGATNIQRQTVTTTGGEVVQFQTGTDAAGNPIWTSVATDGNGNLLFFPERSGVQKVLMQTLGLI